MKMILAAMVTMLAVSANAGGVCNPEQEACPVGNVAGVPSWVGKMDQWFKDHGFTQGGGVCNPEQSECPVGNVAGVPSWVGEMDKWFADHGFQKTNPFDDTKGQ